MAIKSMASVSKLGLVVPVICIVLFSAFVSLLATQTALASEGGSSAYTPGTYGDFAMNIVPGGWSVRENVFYLYGTIDDYPVFAGVNAKSDASAWVNLIQGTWATTDFQILGGRYFANINLPYAFDGDMKAEIIGFGEEKDSTSGLGDVQVVPIGLAWDNDNFHFIGAENVIAPTGQYDAQQLANVGRNYWSFETIFGMTWLNEERGHEISFNACYTINTENDDTNYKTGDELHVDYTLAQFFSEAFGIGAVGYFYTQLTDDSGEGYDAWNMVNGNTLDGYRSEGAGIGPAILWAPAVGGRPLTLIAKWLYDYEGENRFKGGWAFFSAAITF